MRSSSCSHTYNTYKLISILILQQLSLIPLSSMSLDIDWLLCLILFKAPCPRPVVPFFLLQFVIRLSGRTTLDFTLSFHPVPIIPHSAPLIVSLSSLEPFPDPPQLLMVTSHNLAPVSLSRSSITWSHQEFQITCGSQGTLFSFQSLCLSFCYSFIHRCSSLPYLLSLFILLLCLPLET